MNLIRSRRWGLAALAVAFVCAAAFLLLVLSTAIETRKGLLAGAFILGAGILSAGSAIIASNEAPAFGRHWTAWLKPRPIGLCFLAIFAGLGAMTDLLSLFEPRPAIESAPGAIEKGIGRIEKGLDRVGGGEEQPARARLPGIWGEAGCSVTYRFAIREQAILVRTLRRPPGKPYWSTVYTIVASPRTDTIEAREETPAAPAYTFTYETNGVTERLRWHDRRRPVPLDLERCPKGA
ncbi:MAG: hypothetical protein ACJ8ER_04035 [Allosphingosinicella sp.]